MVKLDTNGCFPEVLEECLGNIDYVAMDVKTSLNNYKLLGAEDISAILRSIEMLKTGKIPYEFRTTVVPGLITAEEVVNIGEVVKGAKTYAFQQFVAQDTLDKKFETIKPYAPEKIEEFAGMMQKFTENTLLRI
jgi:pyruvate formate lyase activating enzyme